MPPGCWAGLPATVFARELGRGQGVPLHSVQQGLFLGLGLGVEGRVQGICLKTCLMGLETRPSTRGWAGCVVGPEPLAMRLYYVVLCTANGGEGERRWGTAEALRTRRTGGGRDGAEEWGRGGADGIWRSLGAGGERGGGGAEVRREEQTGSGDPSEQGESAVEGEQRGEGKRREEKGRGWVSGRGGCPGGRGWRRSTRRRRGSAPVGGDRRRLRPTGRLRLAWRAVRRCRR